MTVMDCIGEYVGGVDYRIPIFTNDIYKYVETRIPDVRKDVLNEYVTRYAKSNPEFVRYQKGIYYKTVTTPFGKVGISYTELIKRMYLMDGDEVFGYETGPSFMNKIGLTTQMPTHTYLVTERTRVVVAEDNDRLLLFKPIIKVTKDNFRYLQFLDLLDNRMKVRIEAENYQEILRNYVDKYKLNFELLLCYARYYKNNKIYGRIAELARGETKL